MRRQRFLVGVLTVALVASACSSSSSDDDATTTTEAAVTTTTADTVEDTTTTTTAEVVDDEPARVVEAPDPDPTPVGNEIKRETSARRAVSHGFTFAKSPRDLGRELANSGSPRERE